MDRRKRDSAQNLECMTEGRSAAATAVCRVAAVLSRGLLLRAVAGLRLTWFRLLGSAPTAIERAGRHHGVGAVEHAIVARRRGGNVGAGFLPRSGGWRGGRRRGLGLGLVLVGDH